MKEKHINQTAENQSDIPKIYKLEKEGQCLRDTETDKILVYPQMIDPKKSRDLIKGF